MITEEHGMQKTILLPGRVFQRSHWGISLPLTAILILAFGLTCPGHAAEFACPGRDVACLIAAIHAANGTGEANTLTLAAGTYTLTVVDNVTTAPNGLPLVISPLRIQGAGADQTIIERAASAPHFRLGHIASMGRLTLEGMTLRGGAVCDSGPGGFLNEGELTLTWARLTDNAGGGIQNQGTCTLLQSTLARNDAGVCPIGGSGGGLANDGVATVVNTTFVDNHTAGRFGGDGGGIRNRGTLKLVNSTLTGNGPSVGGGGGGLYASGGTVFLLNSTLVGNYAYNGGGIEVAAGGTVFLQNTLLARNISTADPPRGPDCITFGGQVTSLGHNLIGDLSSCSMTLLPSDRTGDPGVGDVTDPGVPGQGYVPLLPTSQAIDAGDPAACPATDQLGQLRVTPCDIGAIEFSPVTITLGLNQVKVCPGETLRVALGIHNLGPSVTADAYLGILLPDGVTVLFITHLAPLDGVVTRLDADPRTFTPLAPAYEFLSREDITVEDFFVYTLTGAELPGPYALFTLLTPPGAFADGHVDTGDLLGLTWQPFTISP
jgi:hypothetical protein